MIMFRIIHQKQGVTFTGNHNMKFICSLITVEDINRSRFFYEEVLGQKVLFDYGENVSFEGGFSIHQRNHFKQLIDNKEIIAKANNFELYFEYDDVREIENRMIEHDIEFVHKSREQPWRQKVLRFYDPDGNIIEIGESLDYLSYRLYKEGLSSTKISEIITMPINFIETAIQKFNSLK